MRLDLEALACVRAEEQVAAIEFTPRRWLNKKAGDVIGTCSVPGCERPVYRGRGCAYGMCCAHTRRKERGQDMTKPIRAYRVEAWARVRAAAVDYGTALTEGEDIDEQRAEVNLRCAIRNWVDKGGAKARES